MPDDPVPDDAPGLRAANARLRVVVEARAVEIEALQASSITGSVTGDSGNHPGYVLGTWLRDYKKQVFLFTRDFAVPWTNNISERGAKAAKRHQAASGHWHTLAASPAGAW